VSSKKKKRLEREKMDDHLLMNDFMKKTILSSLDNIRTQLSLQK